MHSLTLVAAVSSMFELLLSFIFLILLVLGGYGLALVVMYWKVSGYYRSTGRSFYFLGVTGTLVFYLQIIRAVVLQLWWLLSKGANHQKPLLDKHSEQDAVLFVHGFHMSGSCFWGFRTYLERRGLDTFSLNLGRPYINPARYIDSLHRALGDTVAKSATGQVHLVAHSMGGLICRMLLERYPQDRQLIRSIVTLGTPHGGTLAVSALSLPWLQRLFHPDSELLHSLSTFQQSAPDLPVMTLGSRNDLVVYPLEYALLDGTTRVRMCAISHVGMLTEKRVYKRVYLWLHRQQDRLHNAPSDKEPGPS